MTITFVRSFNLNYGRYSRLHSLHNLNQSINQSIILIGLFSRPPRFKTRQQQRVKTHDRIDLRVGTCRKTT